MMRLRHISICMFYVLFFCVGVEGQNLVLVEHFTNTPCPICARNNPKVYEVLDKYPDQVHHISIHTDAPYPNCELHLFNAPDNKARQSYYGINSTPRVYINGMASTTAQATFEADLLAAMMQDRPLGITLKETSGNSRNVEVQVTANQSLEASDYRIFVAVVERTVNYAAPNGETVHRDVLRDYVTSADGDPITLPQAGEASTLLYDVTIPAGVAVAEAYTMVYVQDLTTREVLGSAVAGQGTTSFEDVTLSSGLRIYPVPARSLIQASVDQAYTIRTAEIFDFKGTKLLERTYHESTSQIALPLQELVAGNYLLRLHLNGGIASASFIKEEP